ncbi:hypothetical protein MXB_4803, partial [Myxobolus squamalis]
SYNKLEFFIQNQAIFLVGIHIIIYLITYILVEAALANSTRVFKDFHCFDPMLKFFGIFIIIYWLVSASWFSYLYYFINKISSKEHVIKITYANMTVISVYLNYPMVRLAIINVFFLI